MKGVTYDFVTGITELLANQFVLPFLGLIAASGRGNGVNERHVGNVVRAEAGRL